MQPIFNLHDSLRDHPPERGCVGVWQIIQPWFDKQRHPFPPLGGKTATERSEVRCWGAVPLKVELLHNPLKRGGWGVKSHTGSGFFLCGIFVYSVYFVYSIYDVFLEMYR